MPSHAIVSFLIFIFIGAFTPGPGNILALNTVTNYGYKRGRPLFWGIFIGYYIVQSTCAVFVYGVSTFLPNLLGVMKYIGAAYIVGLSIHIAISKRPDENTEKSASFLKGLLLQLVNVKIFLLGITALTGFITDYSTSFPVLLFFELIIATMGTLGTLTWIGAGVLLQKIYLKHFRLINIILAVFLLQCAVSMLR